MKWYDIFSHFYDHSLEKIYAESRERAVELLELKDGQTILDVACGTGANFKHIRAGNSNVVIYGTDISSGMLRKAQDLIDRSQWKDIHLFQADARELTPASIEGHVGRKVVFDSVICVLGLSVIPQWEMVLDNLLDLLKEHGKIVVVDVFAEKRNFNTWLVERIASADLDRKIRQTIEAKTENFHHEYLRVKESKVGGRLFVAAGSKRGSRPHVQ